MPDSSYDTRMRWFARGITVLLIVVCNGLLVFGWWVSGLNLEVALSKPEIYDVKSHYCVRVKWMEVGGVDQRVKVCTEWLDLSDPTGNTHSIREGEALTVDMKGELQYQHQRDEDYRLLALILFVVLVIGTGMWAKRVMLTRYAKHLKSLEGRLS
ncbi:MAG: hypothetical protein MRJ96_11035 [Nitrospirales bacterium]|nr:hypothetical protein [Nitrospira sp.]MDR4501974.1 hypothetical protein [Nitrospirales bacterium]